MNNEFQNKMNAYLRSTLILYNLNKILIQKLRLGTNDLLHKLFPHLTKLKTNLEKCSSI